VHEAEAAFDIEKLDESLHRGSNKREGGRTGCQFGESTSPDFARCPSRFSGIAVSLPGPVGATDIAAKQLKEVAQLDGWLRNGSAAYVESLCEWPQ
jgi:hypothetical protein